MQVLRNAYPKCMSFFFSFPNEGLFFGSTPERLIRLQSKSIETEALAGTISRGKNMEEDRLFADSLQGSHKECEEHRFVLEEILRKLEPLTNQLDFSDFPEILKLKMPQIELNFLPADDIKNLMTLADFDVVQEEWKQLLPISLFGIGSLINKYLATLPIIRRLCLRNYIVGRSLKKANNQYESCSVIIPCKNEKGNIESAILRIPDFCENLEIIFIEFWNAITSGKGEYINGSRLVYPMEKDAMRFLNLIANQLFSKIFSWLLNQRYTDTLCGTKALLRSDYKRIKSNRLYFGDFDPFGDFDLIFGSSKLNLKMVEIPIEYKARIYGKTQIARFRHGLQLLRMVLYGYRKLKAL